MKNQEVTDLYFYLTRRDKKGVRILARLQSSPQSAVRVADLNLLQLPTNWNTQIAQIIYDSRMLWEPWVQSANSYSEFKNSLKMRGYTNIPINGQPEIALSNVQMPLVNVTKLPQRSAMIRKN